eukprot:COSAG01_NODE_3115_length_6565_cov_23.371172_5_plen_149_part_00
MPKFMLRSRLPALLHSSLVWEPGRNLGAEMFRTLPTNRTKSGQARTRELDREGLCAKYFRERPELDPTSSLENLSGMDWRTTGFDKDGESEGEWVRDEWRCIHCNKMDMTSMKQWTKHCASCDYRPRPRAPGSASDKAVKRRTLCDTP